MPLELRTQRDGSLRPTWYGRYEINGSLIRLNLFVKIAGVPPASRSLRDEGNGVFERSRAAAQAKLDAIVEEARTKLGSARLVEKLYEIKTGETIRSILLSNFSEEWETIARKRKPNERYASQCKSTLKRFAEFIHQQKVNTVEIGQVTRTMARLFMDAESKRGVTAKTWNDTLKLLRATFKYLLPAGCVNPFAGMPTREIETVFRMPFSPDELAAISEAAIADDFIRPIIIVGICTAMRRGDCCLLSWKNVDMAKRFITVKTSKTDQMVIIPIFPMLHDELSKRQTPFQHSERYVFPKQAQMYLKNPDGITRRVKNILAAALNDEVVDNGKTNALPEVSKIEMQKRGEEFIGNLPEGEKRTRMAEVFKFYLEGKNIKEVMMSAKVSKGSVSGYLNEIQTAISCRIVRGPSHNSQQSKGKKAENGLQIERKVGLRRASVRDFHSFRVTWVTLALTAGVPLELVQKVTGHKTTDIISSQDVKHFVRHCNRQCQNF